MMVADVMVVVVVVLVGFPKPVSRVTVTLSLLLNVIIDTIMFYTCIVKDLNFITDEETVSLLPKKGSRITAN